MIAVVSPTVKLHHESLFFGKETLLSKHRIRKRDLFIVLCSNRMEKVTTSFSLDNYIQTLLLHQEFFRYNTRYELSLQSSKRVDNALRILGRNVYKSRSLAAYGTQRRKINDLGG